MDHSLEAALRIIEQQIKQIAQLEAMLEYRKTEEVKQKEHYEKIIKSLNYSLEAVNNKLQQRQLEIK